MRRNDDFEEFDRVAAGLSGRAILAIVIILTLLATGGVWYAKYMKNAEYQVYKESVVYNEAAAQDLANYKYQLETASDPVSKASIAKLVVDRFGSYDPDKLQDKDLAQFLKDCENGVYAVKGN
jgi:hypothetical protein